MILIPRACASAINTRYPSIDTRAVTCGLGHVAAAEVHQAEPDVVDALQDDHGADNNRLVRHVTLFG
jgi:hypothetical protein